MNRINIKYVLSRSLLVLLLFLTMLFLATAVSACEPLITIHVQNKTDETLQIEIDEVPVGKALPDGEVTHQTYVIFSTYSVIAKDMDGNIVHTANFTREDISGKKTHSVVIPAIAKGEQSDNATGK